MLNLMFTALLAANATVNEETALATTAPAKAMLANATLDDAPAKVVVETVLANVQPNSTESTPLDAKPKSTPLIGSKTVTSVATATSAMIDPSPSPAPDPSPSPAPIGEMSPGIDIISLPAARPPEDSLLCRTHHGKLALVLAAGAVLLSTVAGGIGFTVGKHNALAQLEANSATTKQLLLESPVTKEMA